MTDDSPVDVYGSPVDLLAFYQLQENAGTVVQVVGRTRDKLRLCAVESGETWAVNKEPFRNDVVEGYIQRVTPEWRIVGDA